MRTIIQGGTIVGAGDTVAADVLVEDEKIAAIGKLSGRRRLDDKVIDARGLLVMPGGIDPHTHLDMPFGGTRSTDDFFTGHKAAAFGGTTTHIDFAIQRKGESLIDGIRTWKAKAEGKAVIDYSFHISVADPTDETIAEIPRLNREGVSSIKVFLAYKNVFQMDDTTFLKILGVAGEVGILTLVHAENGDAVALISEKLLAEGKNDMKYHNVAHSAVIEAEAMSRAVDFVEITGSPLYIVHVASGQGLQAVRRGRLKGLPVMAETCSQYLTLTDKAIETGGFEGAKYICSPPPKTAWDQSIIHECLADGTIQTVATDHCPFWFDGTKKGRFAGKELGRSSWAKVPNGVPGIEDRFTVLWHVGVNSGLIGPERFVALASTNAAKIFGLYPRKGTISVGSDADIVLFDPNKKHKISAGTHHMNVDYNVYEGLEVKGWPVQVFVRGRLLVEDGEWLGEAGFGKFISRTEMGRVL
ncbi:Dihydropyrimidinase @ D-hydantoinase [Olavius algarvensis spirochete endosymbiont]|uniref:dihydropyrimidinase n=1 Tax=Olavius algarvensis spirochete endosymbiont TaxID=260710 RepID=UPI000F1D8C0F|nr:dihydropyrimidinase [Olavius algarvensis spirochete endosymbiont]VDA99409.1 Dihydropyrimidinase @ D-hydantoinase [Olavius algarvensis spirochete endosymbiont]